MQLRHPKARLTPAGLAAQLLNSRECRSVFELDDLAAYLGRQNARRAIAGMPFAINGDGTYNSDLNLFLRGLPDGITFDGTSTAGATSSENSWLALASDIYTFLDWCEALEPPVEIARITWRDLKVYKDARLQPESRISPPTWARQHSSLKRFFDYLVLAGRIAQNPLAPSGQVILKTKSSRRSRTRFVTLAEYDDWIDVGVLGLEVDGREPKYPSRVEAYSDLLLRTGMRKTEAASLLTREIETARGFTRRPLTIDRYEKADLTLPTSITKGAVERNVPLYHAAIRDMRALLDNRDLATAQGLQEQPAHVTGRYQILELENWTLLSPKERLSSLLRSADGRLSSPLLFVQANGLPVQVSAWESSIRRANQRCREKGLAVSISARTLRATFAVNTLSLLLEGTLDEVKTLVDRGATMHTTRLAKLTLDPINRLRLLLGHANYATTIEHYLPYVAQATEVTDSALRRWQSTLGQEAPS